jgi:hypothetical protein
MKPGSVVKVEGFRARRMTNGSGNTVTFEDDGACSHTMEGFQQKPWVRLASFVGGDGFGSAAIVAMTVERQGRRLPAAGFRPHDRRSRFGQPRQVAARGHTIFDRGSSPVQAGANRSTSRARAIRRGEPRACMPSVSSFLGPFQMVRRNTLVMTTGSCG